MNAEYATSSNILKCPHVLATAQHGISQSSHIKYLAETFQWSNLEAGRTETKKETPKARPKRHHSFGSIIMLLLCSSLYLALFLLLTALCYDRHWSDRSST